MYNQIFLDTMDKVNSIAKTIGFQNGIAWARKQLENGMINEFTFNSFNNCHDLRNLMAHGASRDINISAETMQNAQLFLKSLNQPYTINNSNPIMPNMRSGNIQTHAHLEVQVGDFVIIMYKNKTSLVIRTNDRVSIEVGTVFKVVEITSRSVILENLNNGTVCDYNALQYGFTYNLYDGIYVFKTNFLGFTPNNNKPVYILGRPELNKHIKDSPFIQVEYSTDSPYGNFMYPCRYENLEVRRVSAKGYLAHIDCFDKTKSKPLFDFTKGDECDYLGNKNSSYRLRDDDDALPF